MLTVKFKIFSLLYCCSQLRFCKHKRKLFFFFHNYEKKYMKDKKKKNNKATTAIKSGAQKIAKLTEPSAENSLNFVSGIHMTIHHHSN